MSRSNGRVTRSQTKKARIEKRERERERMENQQDLLDGLYLTQDGFVKIDENLLQRLRPVSEIEMPIERRNPFENYQVFMETVSSGTPLTLEDLNEFSQTMRSNPDAVKMAEMIGNFPVDWLSLKRSKMLENNWDYSVKMPINPKVTNQGHSGRCWCMAAYNNMRYSLIRKFNLDSKFEFSEAYLFFYDKIERANMFLEYIWTLRDRELQDREVRAFTDPSNHFTSDGGLFTYFVNLVSKYGLVPKNVYDEGFNSMVSVYLNQTLITVLNHMALEIFQNRDNWTRQDFEQKKKENNTIVYDLVVRFLGEPPKPSDNFTWTFKDEYGHTQKIHNLTPEKFYRTVVPHEHDTKMVIINDPRHPETYHMTSWVANSLNMIGGTPVHMINLPMDEFKAIICESLKNEDTVWFGADIGKCFDSESNTSDTNRFDYKSVLGTDIEFEKGEMLDMLTATPNHAMTLIGVDTIEDLEGKVTGYKKWRVENSWGMQNLLEDDPDFGYYRMTDDYFNKYVYEAAVDLKYFNQDTMQKIMDNANNGNSFTYSPYDAFGVVALRTPCKHCNSKRLERPNFKK